MRLRLETKLRVKLFAVGVTLIAVLGCLVLEYLLLAEGLFVQVYMIGILITVILTFPIIYFVGTKMLDIEELSQRLEHAVNHDNLTGMCTRVSFYQRLSTLKCLPLTMIVTDIDHFKKINDTYGHQAGDTALTQFAATLMRNCREDDVIARFGGEEFVILLPDTALSDGVLAAERLCEQVRNKAFVVNNEQIQITASFGVAEVPGINEVDMAIHQADLASYRAKRDGRDRVCVFDPEIDIWDTGVAAA